MIFFTINTVFELKGTVNIKKIVGECKISRRAV